MVLVLPVWESGSHFSEHTGVEQAQSHAVVSFVHDGCKPTVNITHGIFLNSMMTVTHWPPSPLHWNEAERDAVAEAAPLLEKKLHVFAPCLSLLPPTLAL